MAPRLGQNPSGWSVERVEALKIGWGEGKSASQIAKLLGSVTRNAVIGKISRLGLQRRSADAIKASCRNNRWGAHEPAPIRVSHTRTYVMAESRPLAPLKPEKLDATATIETLTSRACKWPIGDPNDPSFGFCGRLKDIEASYCATHHKIAHQPAKGPRTEAQAAGDEARRHKAMIRYSQRRAA